MNTGELLALPDLVNDLVRVDDALHAGVTSSDEMLSHIAAHLLSAGGKRLRPALAVAAAHSICQGPVSDAVINAAIAVEYVHLGSLYHDDVLDQASTRRSIDSVNQRWGNTVAVLSGDYLLARASGLAANLGAGIPGILAVTIERLCEGQIRELQYNFDINRSVEDYENCIAGKTAALLDTSARIGALAAGADASISEALGEFGYYFGMAFQVRDDILDIVSNDDTLGKPAGNDLLEGVYTLPVIFALQEQLVGNELASLLSKHITPEERDHAIAIVRGSRGIDAALQIGRHYSSKALAALKRAPQNTITDQFRSLTEGIFNDVV